MNTKRPYYNPNGKRLNASIEPTKVVGGVGEEFLAPTIGDLFECQCCGRKIRKAFSVSNGMLVGSECATYLGRPDLRANGIIDRVNAKADAVLIAGGFA